MLEMDTRDIHSLTDFLRNHKVHRARIKSTRTAEILTVHGRPELVILTADSYQQMIDHIRHMEAVAMVRADIVRSEAAAAPPTDVSEADIERSQAVMRELVAETERLGLYK